MSLDRIEVRSKRDPKCALLKCKALIKLMGLAHETTGNNLRIISSTEEKAKSLLAGKCNCQLALLFQLSDMAII